MPPSHQASTNSDTAAKSDDADVPTFLWDDRVAFLRQRTTLSTLEQRASNILRRTMHLAWVRNVSSSWWLWWKAWKSTIVQQEPVHWTLIRAAGAAAVCQASASDFWEWKSGSTPFFWRWDAEYLRDIALGVPPMWVDRPPSRIVAQKN